MQVIQTVSELRNELNKWRNHTIGLVPTMGYLHQGHMSLVDKAREECDCVVLSIFVNPLQFGENEDVDIYPRDINRDKEIAKKAGVDILFFPSENEMYPFKPLTQIHIREITQSMCGASRPGHFDGVALVVAKLFNMVMPHRAYFGAKDAQQVAVIQQLVLDLSFPIDIVVCPTFREKDGLAMSSRNVYLGIEERKQAVSLFTTLQEARKLLEQGVFTHAKELNQFVANKIDEMPLAEVVYVETRTYPGMQEMEELTGKGIIAVAVKFGKTRLIDNCIV